MSQSETCIANLPDEVLVMIFGLLKHGDLLNCCLVNKRWNDIISESSQFLDKTLLKITSVPHRAANNKLEFERSYRHVELRSIILETNMLNTLEIVSASLHSLELNCMKMIVGDFLNLLNLMQNLQSLTVRKFKVKVYGNSALQNPTKVTLNNLKVLNLHSSLEVLQYIKCIKMDELIIQNEEKEFYGHSVIEFLSNVNELRRLDLYNQLFAEYDFSKFEPKFSLDSLFIDFNEPNIPEYYKVENNAAMWRKLINSMTQISILTIYFTFPQSCLMELIQICSENSRVTNIRVALNGLQHAYQIDYANFPRLTHVKSLDLGFLDDENHWANIGQNVDDRLDPFLQLFPILNTLTFDNKSIEYINPYTISTTFANLRKLIIKSIFGITNIPPVSFPNLDTLIIKDFLATELEFLKQFARDQAKLKHIKLHFDGSIFSWGEYICFTLYMFTRKLESIEIKTDTQTIYRTRSDLEMRYFGHVLSEEMRNEFQEGIDDVEEMRL